MIINNPSTLSGQQENKMQKVPGIIKSIHVKAPVKTVWETLTNPVNMEKWLSDPALSVKSEWKIGSEITFSGKWHGVVLKDKGTLLAFEPYSLFSYNYWSSLSHLPDTLNNRSVITFRLTDLGDETGLHFSQENLKGEAVVEHVQFYWNVTLGIIGNMAEKKTERQQI